MSGRNGQMTKPKNGSAVASSGGGVPTITFVNGVRVILKGGSGEYCGVKFRLHGDRVKVSTHGQSGVIVGGAELSPYGEAHLSFGGHLTVNRQNGKLIRG